MKHSELYDRACKKGKMRKDEYSKLDYIADANDLARSLWTTIYQGVNGNKPSVDRSETVVISGNLDTVHTRTIQSTPILKIVQDDWTEIEQHTDKTNDFGFPRFEYDDEDIRFKNAVDGSYKVFYEAPEYTKLTEALYDADNAPTWLKSDFHPIFWAYTAFLNTDTMEAKMGELYHMYLQQFRHYYSRTETLEEQVLTAHDTTNQL